MMLSKWFGNRIENKTTKIITLSCPGHKGDCMQFLALIEALSKTLTADNIETVVSLVEKLVALGESIKQSATTPPTPPAQ